MSRHRNWVFTIFNYDQNVVDDLSKWDCSYIIYGKETCPKTNNLHLQGYCEFRRPMGLFGLKKLHGEAHWESRRGTQDEAINYCKKENDYYEIGVPKKQGLRSDLDAVRQQVEDDGMRGVSANRNLQQIKVAEKYLTYNEEPRDWKPEVTWIYGETGVGKSKVARELCDMEDCFIKNNGTKWWDGYDAHNSVIIDDFRDSWWSLTEMLALLDRYEKRVEYKGGLRQFKPRKIVITSAKAPDECYMNTGERIDQLLRRIDTITHFENAQK